MQTSVPEMTTKSSESPHLSISSRLSCIQITEAATADPARHDSRTYTHNHINLAPGPGRETHAAYGFADGIAYTTPPPTIPSLPAIARLHLQVPHYQHECLSSHYSGQPFTSKIPGYSYKKNVPSTPINPTGEEPNLLLVLLRAELVTVDATSPWSTHGVLGAERQRVHDVMTTTM